MPFAENACAIPRRLETLSHCYFRFADNTAAEIDLDSPCPLRVATGEQGSSGRRAKRLHVKVGELRALTRQSVQMRRLKFGIPMKAHIAKSLVIRKDEITLGLSDAASGVTAGSLSLFPKLADTIARAISKLH